MIVGGQSAAKSASVGRLDLGTPEKAGRSRDAPVVECQLSRSGITREASTAFRTGR